MRASLSLPAMRQLYAQLKRPKPLPDRAFVSKGADSDLRLFDACWRTVSADWEFHVANLNSEALFQTWNNLAESFCARALISSGLDKYKGRGSCPTFVLQPAAGVSRPTPHGGAQTTCRERMLRKLARQIEFLRSQIPTGLAVWPQHLIALRAKIQHRCHILKFDFNEHDLENYN